MTTRRHFLSQSLAATSATVIPVLAADSAPQKIRLGLVGCGGRGGWIANLFSKHGGYQLAGAADYFEERAKAVGDAHGLKPDQLFTGLKGYERMIAKGGLDAVAIISPPYFRPEQTRAAVEAGLHCYLAKPIAVDVPGCLEVKALGERARAEKRVFLIDFQSRANPIFIEAMKRVQGGALGTVCFGEAMYHANRLGIQGNPSGPEGRLRNWVFDKALSGDIITEQNIHSLDMMNWAMNHVNPLSATGSGGRKSRTDVGDCRDHFALVFQYPDNVAVTFSSRQFNGWAARDAIAMNLTGSTGVLQTEYGGNVMIRGPQSSYFRGGSTGPIYEEGVVENIKTFHAAITGGEVSNPTLEPSIQSNLITIMGRMATDCGRTVTWDEMIQSKERADGRLDGLKA